MNSNIFGTVRKEELRDLIHALLLAHHATYQQHLVTQEAEAFARGYQSGLMALATATGLMPEVQGNLVNLLTTGELS